MVADHKAVKHQIAIAIGQLEGVLKMIDEDSYCIDVSNQILAAIAGLKKADNMVIQAHLRSCVEHAKDQKDLDQKMIEIGDLLKRISR
ncbi:MAG: metal-sensing transcriptional repressor [Bacilli bacterium]|jgi:DNA-binding FrmR family transcriptional regulator|nr:metal-sensing transcriptional repressor [Bacilli bacterium]